MGNGHGFGNAYLAVEGFDLNERTTKRIHIVRYITTNSEVQRFYML